MFKAKLGLNSNHVIVDMGSGTGIFSELFLQNGNTVFAVEPNKKMRESAEKNLSKFTGFKSVEGSSEKTGLPNQCADFIIAAQAFHWFKPEETKIEFARILKPGGTIILMWNDRKISGSPFLSDYETLINQFGTDYKQVSHKNIAEERIRQFLGPFEVYKFSNFQEFDFVGLLGRLASSSYSPNVGHPRYEEMHQALKKLFDKHNLIGIVRLEYETQVFYSETRPDFIKHYSEIQEGPESSYYQGSKEFQSIGSPFAKTFGLKKLGIHHELLPPGRRTSWPHAEENEEEFIYVIEGHPDVWINGRLHRLNPGDGIGFQCGTGISHTFLNNTSEDVRLLVVGEASKKDSKIYYPLNPTRREQCVESWWHNVPKHDHGPHDGLPDKIRGSEPLGILNYTGEIIIESLSDNSIIQKLEPYRIKSRMAEMPNEPVKLWHIHRYCIDEPTLLKMLPEIEAAIDKGAWYVHFYSDLGNKMLVIFKGKHFLVSKRKDSSWESMIQFGESIGVERRWTESIPIEFKI